MKSKDTQIQSYRSNTLAPVQRQTLEFLRNFIADKGYDVQFGARPLHRAIQKYIEDPLAEEILNHSIKEGDTLMGELDKENNKLTFTLQKKEKEKAPKAPKEQKEE